MYKKITHTIVEEHFGHPRAGEIKEALDSKNVMLKYFAEPVSIDKFRADASNYYSTLTNKLTETFKQVESGNDAGTLEAEKTVFDGIDNLGNMFKPFYGIEFGERFNQFNRNFALTALAIAKNLKNKVDFRDWRNRFDMFKFDLSNMLNVNNNLWRQPDTQIQLGQIIDEFVKYEQAIMNRDSALEASTREKVQTLWSAFVNSLVYGLSQQHADKFTK